ncbi:hypothetical protein ZHAS_00001386 [Anopheles sinensis]|uniref:Uncharacterized protein n=1 Tax=Anopheles sinensis TaxID=74873 RepID=A0A084VB99_ANOSI|nr:hypothetical protein ZHAS_00001386 [Anopheles sinensis]
MSYTPRRTSRGVFHSKTTGGGQHMAITDERSATTKLILVISAFLVIAQQRMMRKLSVSCWFTTSDKLDGVGTIGECYIDRCSMHRQWKNIVSFNGDILVYIAHWMK